MSAKHYQILIIYIYAAYISLAFNKYSILTLFHTINDFKESVQIGIIYGRKPVRFMCSHSCLCRRRPIPSRLNNKLFDSQIGKTESQSEFVFKGQLGWVLQTPRTKYYTVQQCIGSAIDRQAHFNSEKYTILKFDSITQKNTLYQVIILIDCRSNLFNNGHKYAYTSFIDQ